MEYSESVPLCCIRIRSSTTAHGNAASQDLGNTRKAMNEVVTSTHSSAGVLRAALCSSLFVALARRTSCPRRVNDRFKRLLLLQWKLSSGNDRGAGLLFYIENSDDACFTIGRGPYGLNAAEARLNDYGTFCSMMS